MLESILAGLLDAARAMASFDAFRKGRKGDVRALVEELKANSRLCFRVVQEGVDHRLVIAKFATGEFDRLNTAGFDFNALKAGKIAAFAGLDRTDLAALAGKTTAELVENIYDKIKDLKSLHEFKPDGATNRRRLINIHKRILLLIHHVRS